MQNKIIAGLFVLMLFSSCVKDTPEQVTGNFVVALYYQDWEVAERFMTEESKDQLYAFIETGDSVPKFTAITCNLVNQPYCQFCCDAEGDTLVLDIKQVDEDWKVDFSKGFQKKDSL